MAHLAQSDEVLALHCSQSLPQPVDRPMSFLERIVCSVECSERGSVARVEDLCLVHEAIVAAVLEAGIVADLREER